MSFALLRNLPEAFTHAEALARGLSDRVLHQMIENEDIERLARGIYARPTLQADPNLVEIAIRAREATLCLTSALAHHDLTDDIPPMINVALPRARRAPKTAAPVTWHRFDQDTFDVGRDVIHLTEHHTIGIYNPTRSIIDAYRLRHLYGVDQANQALKRWLRIRGNQPADVLRMAKNFPAAEPTIRVTLETLL